MKENLNFPFKLVTTLFSFIQCARKPEIPDDFQLGVNIQLNVLDDDFPQKIQINLKVFSLPDQPFYFNLELIAIFIPTNQPTSFPKENIPDFVNQRALFMLWPYIVSEVRDLTVKMGINSITLETPSEFHYKPALVTNHTDSSDS